jgi:hypothetical protein
MATPYNPYSMALPSQQDQQNQQKVNQQVANSSGGKKASPETLRLIREARKIPRVRVEPTSEAFRRALRHPNGMAFRAEGSVEWPMDRFTRRRITEGAVKIVESAEGRQERQTAKEHSGRERAAPPKSE